MKRQFHLFQGTIAIHLVLGHAWAWRYHLKPLESSRLVQLPSKQPTPSPACPVPLEIGKIPQNRQIWTCPN